MHFQCLNRQLAVPLDRDVLDPEVHGLVPAALQAGGGEPVHDAVRGRVDDRLASVPHGQEPVQAREVPRHETGAGDGDGRGGAGGAVPGGGAPAGEPCATPR